MYDNSATVNHAVNMRRHILDMALHAGNHAAHLGGALSMIDILAVLYFDVMNIRETGTISPERDRCILSKGHGALGYYAALIEAGLADEKLKYTFEDDESVFLGHPVYNRDIGIEFTNGSLGMGLGLGIGVAIANKKRKRQNRVFVLLGDGECNEGSCWESFMAAPHYKLNNLIAIVDYNGFQLSGTNKEVMPIGDIARKLRAFGWNVKEIDGHNFEEIYLALNSPYKGKKPLAIIAHTIKGKGLSFAENNNSWHHAVVFQKIYDQGITELSVKDENDRV